MIAIVGCERPASLRVDARTGETLKLALIDSLNVFVDHGTNVNSTSNLVVFLKQQEQLKRVESYGLTNCFFNPDLQVWRAVAITNHGKPSIFAVVIRSNPQKYSAILFDGRLAATNQPPAEWCR